MCYTLFPLLTVGKLIPTLKKTHYYGLVLSRILFTVCVISSDDDGSLWHIFCTFGNSPLLFLMISIWRVVSWKSVSMKTCLKLLTLYYKYSCLSNKHAGTLSAISIDGLTLGIIPTLSSNYYLSKKYTLFRKFSK